jgi:nicotinate-nucleotide--dimethylbenzimidazole phosphoribosyltransferase
MFQAPPIQATDDAALREQLQHKIDHKTKPLGALGRVEALALQLGLVLQSDAPLLTSPQIIVFAADHGIAAERVSAYPAAVTPQMVLNMLGSADKPGGAAVNVLARQHGFALTVVDAGVAVDLPDHPALIKRKIAHGTRNSCFAPAMTETQALAALNAGMETAHLLPGNVLALGEMGIGNSSSAALIFSRLAEAPLKDAVGLGTGLDEAGLRRKRDVLMRAHLRHPQANSPLHVLCAFGGFEIAMMCGAMLQAALERRVVLVDGFIAGAAAMLARGFAPAVMDYLVFAHVGAEHGHRLMLQNLQAKPLMDLDLRLGEGSGALMAWPLLQFAANFLNEMASFETAGVANREPAQSLRFS